MNRKLLVTLLIISTLVIGCAKKEPEDNWVYVGAGPEIADIPYRLVETSPFPVTHSDLLSLTLSLQSGRSRGTWVYLPLYDCFAPALRDGIPAMQCYTWNGHLIVGGEDNVREVLLALKGEGKTAAVKAKVMGLSGDDVLVWVSDPTLKRKSN